jgi:hypothetical protein
MGLTPLLHGNISALVKDVLSVDFLVWAAPGALGLRERLAGLGVAGVVAYGLLNTLYYTAAFYFVWTYVARVPRGGFCGCVIPCTCI